MTFPETIPELLAWRVKREGERPWLFFEGKEWTLGEVAHEVDRWAVGLAARGVVKGDRVAILLGNTPATIFAWLGANRLGAIAAILNGALKPPEIAAHLRLIDPKLVVERDDIAADGRPPSVDVCPDDPCVLIATSGTTGAPKAVTQTHRAYTLTAEAFPDWVGLDNDDRLLAILPFFHINAQAYSTMAALACGSLALVRKFSASRFWEDAAALRATQFNSVGALLHILLRTAPREADRQHRIRVCYAALALPEAIHREFESRFGLRLTVGYGMSETTFGTVWPKDEPPRYGTMGKLRQHPRLGAINEGRVTDNGELLLRNPALMGGYFRDERQTAGAIDAEGWLHTGDVVTRDVDGYFTFVSRKKEMLRRRGENIAAAEIENALIGFRGVREAAVIGVPSDLGEDDIMAYLVLDPGTSFDEAALVAHAKEHIADFKVPSKFRVVDDLPRTPTGRVAKHELSKT
jgi:crotonobetaine/carnitine-CoA ligase